MFYKTYTPRRCRGVFIYIYHMKKLLLLVLLLAFTKVTLAQTPAQARANDSLKMVMVMDSLYKAIMADSIAAAAAAGFDESKLLPLPIGFVNDFEDILDQASETAITGLILAHQNKTTNQISVVTVTGFEPYTTIEDYAGALFNKWGIGQEDKNNGILITVSKAQRRVRISTGYGMEDKITNAIGDRIINDIMIPEFKNENFSAGIIKAIDEMVGILEK